MAEHQDKDAQTEKPTQRRLEEARRKGNIPISRDVTATMVLGLLTILLVAVGGTLASDFAKSLHPLLGNADAVSFENGPDPGWAGAGGPHRHRRPERPRHLRRAAAAEVRARVAGGRAEAHVLDADG